MALAGGLLMSSHMRILAITVLASACVAPPTVELDPLDPYADQPPHPSPPTWLNAADGSYDLTTEVTMDYHFDSPFEAYVDAPGTTLLARATEANVPALAAIEAAVPGLTAQLPGWYDEALRGNGYALLAAWTLSLAPAYSSMTATLDGTITLAGTTAGYSFDTITVEGVTTELGMRDGEVNSAVPEATISADPSGGHVSLGFHDVTIDAGTYAYAAILNTLPTSAARVAFGQLTMCPLVAVAVASKCSNGACLALLPQLTEVCERGLDLMFLPSRDVIEAVSLHVYAGSAQILDYDGDRIADRLEGAWSLRPTAATVNAPIWAERN